jgi:hypothetical protein
VFLSNNTATLNVAYPTLTDEEYYGCGYIDSTSGAFNLLDAFFVYLRVPLQIEFKTEMRNESTKYSMASSFRITCIALNAKSDTYLTINDADTRFPLSTKTTNSNEKHCNVDGLCTIMHQVEVLVDAGLSVNGTKDYTCSALSTIPNIGTAASRTVSVSFNPQLTKCKF